MKKNAVVSGETMKKFSSQFRAAVPYFILAVAVIISYRIITEFHVILNFFSGFWNIVKPFFYGFILAYLLNIPFSALQRLFGKAKWKFFAKRKKGLSVIIVYLLFVVTVAFVLQLVIPALYNSIVYFVTNFAAYYERALMYVNYINDLDIISIDISIDGIMAAVQNQLHFVSEDGAFVPMEMLVDGFASTIINLSVALLNTVLAFVSSVYFLLEKEKILSFINRMTRAITSDGVYKTVVKNAHSLNKNFKQYLRTQTMDALILGTIVTIEMLVIRSPFALIIGVTLGLLNYIPYFGSLFGSVAAVIVIALTQGIPVAAIAAVMLIITQNLDGNVIQPKLMGGSFRISPLLVIISITIGGAVSGILGMIFAIPIVAFLKDMTENTIYNFERRKMEKDLLPDETDE